MAAGAATDDETFILESTIRGHHVYKRVWTPVIGQELQVQAERGNAHDLHAVCTLHAGVVVGHMPREIAITASYFLQHGGRITCEVTGPRKLSSVPNKGLVVPCVYTFLGKPKMIKRLIRIVCNKNST